MNGWGGVTSLEKKSRLLKDPPTIEEYKKWLQSIGVKSEKRVTQYT